SPQEAHLAEVAGPCRSGGPPMRAIPISDPEDSTGPSGAPAPAGSRPVGPPFPDPDAGHACPAEPCSGRTARHGEPMSGRPAVLLFLALLLAAGGLTPGCRSSQTASSEPQIVRPGKSWRTPSRRLTAQDERTIEAHARFSAGIIAE